jgi:hypothetical protein
METPNTDALVPLLRRDGLDDRAVHRTFQTFNAAAPPFRAAAEQTSDPGKGRPR